MRRRKHRSECEIDSASEVTLPTSPQCQVIYVTLQQKPLHILTTSVRTVCLQSTGEGENYDDSDAAVRLIVNYIYRQ